MTKRHSFLAAAALAIAGTAATAGYLATGGGAPLQAQPSVEATSARTGVAETEAAVLPPPTPAEIAASQPALPPASAPEAPYRAPRLRPAPRVVARTATPPAASEPRPVAPTVAESTPIDTAPAAPVDAPEYVAPESRYIELTIPANSVLGVRLLTDVSSDTAEIEDRVEASVTRDVIADGRIAIPAGSQLLGSVNDVMRGGKFKEKARLGVRFHTLVLADGTRTSVRVDSIIREGQAVARKSAAKIGAGAVGGAIIGGIMGGKKGAVLGGVAGAGAGTAAVAAGGRSVAELASGTPLSVRLTAPVSVMIERN
jgi:hypothetical protein